MNVIYEVCISKAYSSDLNKVGYAMEEFHPTIPYEVNGIFISLVMIVVGLLVPSLDDLLSIYSLSAIMVLLLQMMIPTGVMLLIVFGISLLTIGESVFQFITVKRVLISSQGITFYNRGDNVSRMINWHEIKQVKFQGKKYTVLGLAEVGRTLVSIELSLIDGSNFKIPVESILKIPDRTRMAHIISFYTAATNPRAAQ